MNDSLKFERPFGIKVIAVINGLAAVLHLIFWISAFLHLYNLPMPIEIAAKANLGTTFGFGLADMVWSITFLSVGSINLWRMRQSGWLAAQFANVLYWYSLTVIMTKDLVSGSLSPGTILFLPFSLFSFWIAYYLWKIRIDFFKQNV